MKMRLSCFGFIKDIDDIAKAGYDCAELHIREIMAFDDAEYKTALAKVRSSGITCEVFNNPVPLDKRVCDSDFDLDYYREFLKKGAERCANMGARYYNYGNGKTRSLPLDGDIVGARKKNAELLAMLCDITAEYNITVLLEPLALRVSNVFLDLPEAVEYTQKFGKPNLKTFIDYRWYLASKRPLEEIEKYADYVEHVHIDNPLPEFPVRPFPKMNDGNDYSQFINILKKICYKGIISIEANTFDDFKTDIAQSLELFKSFGIYPYKS